MTAIAPAAIFGLFGPAQLAVMRSWKRAGVPTCFIHVVNHPDPRFIGAAVDRYLPIIRNELHNPATKRLLADELNRWGVTSVTTLAYANTAYLHELKRDFGMRATVCGLKPEQIPFMNSKLAQNDCATAVGLTCLPTALVRTQSSVPKPDLPFPLVARPDNPAHFKPGFKMALLQTPDDLQNLLRGFKERTGDMVLQSFKQLPNLVIHGFHTPDGRHGPLAAFIVERKYEGVTLTMRPYKVGDDILQKCRAFCDRAETIGPYHFEFLFDEKSDENFFLDFNGRLGGTTGKAYVLGYDEPLSILESFGHVPAGSVRYQSHQVKSRCVTSRVALVKAIICKLSGGFTDVDYLPYTGARAVFDLLLGFVYWKDEVFDLHDPRGALAYFYQSYIGN